VITANTKQSPLVIYVYHMSSMGVSGLNCKLKSVSDAATVCVYYLTIMTVATNDEGHVNL